MTIREVPFIPKLEGINASFKKVLDYIIRAGAQAPSWYNCQPWEFRVSGDQIDVVLDSEADKSFYDWNNFNSMLACGAAVENILIAAKGRGLGSFDIKYFPDQGELFLVARITLNSHKISFSSDCFESSLERCIWTRHTNTLPFSNSLLSKVEKNNLFDAIKPFPDISLHFLETEEGKKQLFQATSSAEQLRFSRRELHEQLHRMIRWDEKQAVKNKTGYTLPSMGVCGFGKLFFRITRPWVVMRIMNLFGAYRGQAKRASQGLLNASAIGLLTIKKTENTDLLEGGRAIERLWLKSTQLGLHLQPHSTITLLHWAWSFGGSKLYSQSEKKILLKAFQQYKNIFSSIEFEEGELGIFLFRVGRGDEVDGFTLREFP